MSDSPQAEVAPKDQLPLPELKRMFEMLTVCGQQALAVGDDEVFLIIDRAVYDLKDLLLNREVLAGFSSRVLQVMSHRDYEMPSVTADALKRQREHFAAYNRK